MINYGKDEKDGIQSDLLLQTKVKYQMNSSSLQRCSVEKVFLEISQNSQENTVPESLF